VPALARPQAVVFDCDGLLLDTESAWTRAEVELYRRHGGEFTLEHKREMVGTDAETSGLMMERHLGLPGEGGRLRVELLDLVLDEVARSAPPRPGAVELVAALRGAGVPVGLASNSPRRFVELALRVSELTEAFDSVLSAEDVERPKPAPDIYAESCRRLGADPAAAVALEDSPTGVAAAKAARMTVIGVPSLPGVRLPEADVTAASLHAAAVWSTLGLRAAA
jgi:HAD superfamily hydrolase (TIGR01509 family)